MNSNEGEVSHRRVLRDISAGVLVATAGSVTAESKPSQSSPQDAGGAKPQMADPTTEYPRPPFAKQQQEWPGLASKMNPRPDHGETSYEGSGRLAGRKALLTGGDSGMGRAAAIAFAREGADVAINYLPVEEPDAREVIELIRREGRKAVALPGDIRSESFCEKLVADANRALLPGKCTARWAEEAALSFRAAAAFNRAKRNSRTANLEIQAKRVALDFAPALSPAAAISMAPVPFSNSFARDTCSAVSQWTDNSVPPFLTWPS
jgi:short chain dehydrogenase